MHEHWRTPKCTFLSAERHECPAATLAASRALSRHKAASSLSGPITPQQGRAPHKSWTMSPAPTTIISKLGAMLPAYTAHDGGAGLHSYFTTNMQHGWWCGMCLALYGVTEQQRGLCIVPTLAVARQGAVSQCCARQTWKTWKFPGVQQAASEHGAASKHSAAPACGA